MPRVEQDYFTEAEKEALRAQVRRMNAEAQAELRRRGVGLHPRVRRLREAGLWPGPKEGGT